MKDYREAMFAAQLHIEKGTMLSDKAVRQVCEALLELRGEVARLQRDAIFLAKVVEEIGEVIVRDQADSPDKVLA